MYKNLVKKCNRILEAEALPTVEIIIEETPELLSFTMCDGTIYMGAVARTLSKLGCRDLMHTVMHEIVHNLMESHASEEYNGVFGTKEEWAAEQKMTRMLALNSMNYVTRYAMTHPDEDFVETVTCLLLSETVPDTECVNDKLEAVKSWMEALKQ